MLIFGRVRWVGGERERGGLEGLGLCGPGRVCGVECGTGRGGVCARNHYE